MYSSMIKRVTIILATEDVDPSVYHRCYKSLLWEGTSAIRLHITPFIYADKCGLLSRDGVVVDTDSSMSPR